MVKEIWCDICGKRIAIEVRGSTRYVGEPPYNAFFQQPKDFQDICTECEQELIDTLHKKLEELKKKKNGK